MHRYMPSTDEQKNEMLKDIGFDSLEALFTDIPNHLRFNEDFLLGKPLSEIEIRKHMNALASKNNVDLTCFLGAGAYDHYHPGIINHIISRSEFFTSYTPYQPEVSQGTLQAIFEFQTMITNLTGMDVTNASMYDGATAAAEALVMACEQAKTNKVIISGAVNPQTIAVCQTSLGNRGVEIIIAPTDSGVTDVEQLTSLMDKDVAGVLVQSPNFFGIIEDLAVLEPVVHQEKKSTFIVSTDPISLGILKSPGQFNADIVVGEAQGIASPLYFGGPYIGFLAATKKLVRKMPGRIVGQTVDAENKRAFVLTLQAREQHIRRFKATSNICSNQGLVMLMTTVYLATMGKSGLKEVAVQSTNKAHYAFNQLTKSGKYQPLFKNQPFFKEFAIATQVDVKKINDTLLEHGILGGYELGKDFKTLENGLLLCVTEKRTKEEIDILVDIMEGI